MHHVRFLSPSPPPGDTTPTETCSKRETRYRMGATVGPWKPTLLPDHAPNSWFSRTALTHGAMGWGHGCRVSWAQVQP